MTKTTNPITVTLLKTQTHKVTIEVLKKEAPELVGQAFNFAMIKTLAPSVIPKILDRVSKVLENMYRDGEMDKTTVTFELIPLKDVGK